MWADGKAMLASAMFYGDRDMVENTNSLRDVDHPVAPDSTATLLAERSTTHGEFRDNALVSQNIKNVMEETKNWDDLQPFQREALHMIAHKIGRILEGAPNFKDHWDDIAGYAKLVADRVPQ